MNPSTFVQLESAFETLKRDASGRAEELAQKSSAGTLSERERAELEGIVRLNDLLSALRLETESLQSLMNG